jgi:hypothetical protein
MNNAKQVAFTPDFSTPDALIAMSDKAGEIAASYDGESAAHFAAWEALSEALMRNAEQMREAQGG